MLSTTPDLWTSRAQPSAEVLHQALNGESVLLNLATEQYFGLDAVGTRIWQLLTDGLAIQEVFDTLLREYEVEPPQLRADLEKLLSNLAAAHLVTLEPMHDAGAPSDSRKPA